MNDSEGLGRVKRRWLTPEERHAAESRARDALGDSGIFPADAALVPLSLSDSAQTYRVTAAGRSAVLKLMPPGWADAAWRVHLHLSARGIALPAVIWRSPATGAVVYEDLGPQRAPFRPDVDELDRIIRYLARLHAAGVMHRGAAMREFPHLTCAGWPTPGTFAATLLRGVGRCDAPLRQRLLDAAEALASWVEERPRLVIGDIKREHVGFRRAAPALIDLELASFWDVPPSNLATLLSFPGQFDPPIGADLKRQLLERYVETRDGLEGTRTAIDQLAEAVRGAEIVMGVTLAKAGAIGVDGWSSLVPGVDPPAPDARHMICDRGLHVCTNGALSIEHELGSDLFRRLEAKLRGSVGLRVLELGCGTGRALEEMSRHWPQHQIAGLDLTPGPHLLRVAVGDARCLPIADRQIDVVLGVQLLQYVDDKLALLADVSRVLTPGGLALFAMTEHFAGRSAFDPSLRDLARASLPAGAFPSVAERSLDGRRVLTFALERGDEPLGFRHRFVGARAADGGGGDRLPYLQSHYVAE